MKRNLLIIDFDNTLFQTRDFWRLCLFPSYEKIGISKENLEEAFRASVTKKVDYFVPEYFLEELHRRIGLTDKKNFSKKKLGEIFNVVYESRAKEYFYKDALKLLSIAKKNSYRILLVSYGNTDFKRKFFRAIDLLKYIFSRDILIINNGDRKYKSNVKIRSLSLKFKTLANYQKVVLVNDNDHPEEIVAMYNWACRLASKVDVYVFDHPKSKIPPREKHFKYFRNLTEIICQL